MIKWAICGYLTLLATLFNTTIHAKCSSLAKKSDADILHKSEEAFNLEYQDRPILIVSTMDGKVSALDIEKNGALMWSIDIGMGPLVSSSITKLEMNQDGKVVRLIPSLSGGLFKFDGSTVEAIPFTADQIFSSSFQVAGGPFLVGKSEVATFGLDIGTGRMVYLCSALGCDPISKAPSNAHIVILKRHQKTVRSVENRSGHESWNFSVGEVDLEISQGQSNHLILLSKQSRFDDHLTEENGKMNLVNTRIVHDTQYTDSEATNEAEESRGYQEELWRQIQVSVPEGIVSLYESDDKKKLQWKYRFTSPIANTWFVHDGHSKKIDLFDPQTVPALREGTTSTSKNDLTIYLGFHDSSAYIQASEVILRAVQIPLWMLNNAPGHRVSIQQSIKFPFHPFKATSNRLTEAIVGEAKMGEIAIFGSSDTKGSCGNNHAVYVEASDRKMTDVGYYLKKSALPYYGLLLETVKKGKTTLHDSREDFFQNIRIDALPQYFLHYWKEILVFTIATLILNIFVAKIFKFSTGNREESSELKTDIGMTDSDTSPVYESRYIHDFEPVHCLGKGGFGIVLESRNKVDACSYAIKRIRLPNKVSSRDKVLREVRALAKLNHRCIVRYFNAWIEEPPEGWQEKLDKEMGTRDLGSLASSMGFSPVSSSRSAFAEHNIQQTDVSFSLRVPFTQKQRENGQSVESGNQLHCFHPQIRENSHNDFFKQTGFPSNHGLLFSSDDEKANFRDNVPFSRYKADDSLSIAFENTVGKPSSSSRDSAIEEDAFDKPRTLLKPSRDLSKHSASFHEESKCDKKSSALRKRLSVKLQPQCEDEARSKSERGNNCSQPQQKEGTDERQKTKNVFLYIQMELCQKESLSVWLTNNREREDHYCLWIFKQVLSAVEYVHECNLIHRDLKPSNIFFSADGAVKVGDFGLATETDELNVEDLKSGGNTLNYAAKEGCHTEQVGTRLYMAPEQMSSCTYSQKVDIFALGLILFELLSPFYTQMERISSLRKARERMLPRDFEVAHHNVAELAKLMLSLEASERPTARQATQHKIFSVSPSEPQA